MRDISTSVTRLDHPDKASGRALYLDDLPRDGVLAAAFVRAEKPNAAILSVACPPLPEGYTWVDGRDLPRNEVLIHGPDMPVFATARVRHVGEAIAMIVGPDGARARQLAAGTVVTYGDEQPAALSLEDAEVYFYDYHLGRGDAEAAFAAADFIHEEVFTTGLQEQAYMETQAMQAQDVDGVLTIDGSMQCPYYIVDALRHAFDRDAAHVRVRQTVTGGGFGGKEDYPSQLACQIAAAAIKTGRPCRAVLDRREDVCVTTKRHPARIAYRAAVRGGRVTALWMDLILDGGAYKGLSSVVLQRGLFCCLGVYNIESFTARARVAMTNTPSNGAFRGFGAPQTFFAIEMLMGHIARRLGEDIAGFKRRHFVQRGDPTSTNGLFHEPVPMPAMLDRALAMAKEGKREAGDASGGRYRRGIGLACVYHGCGFTGNGERDIIKARVRLEKQPDGTVDIFAANTDMGQGIATTFAKIVASVLAVPMDRIRYGMPDTAVSPDSGPTVASRSLMIVGRLLERAAKRLKMAWQEGEKQVVEEDYVDPAHRLPFDMNTFTGDAYPAYSWAVNVVEVEVDTVTMQPRTLGVWAVFDCGTPIDLNVLRGQAEGGIAQGLGHASCEWMDVDASGAIRQKSLTDYILPTAADIPPMQVAFHVDPYYDGPFGARGAGELTVVAAAPAYVAALEDALGITACNIPMTPERIRRIVTGK